METKENIHKGHRLRLTERFIKNTSSLTDHEVLEIILFRALPRINTNPLAHALLRSFGSLKAVLSASLEDLMMVKGIGEKTAKELLLLGQVVKRCYLSKPPRNKMSNVTEKNIEIVKKFFKEQGTEGLLVCLLDDNFRILTQLLYNNGLMHSVLGDFNELVGALSINKPKYVLIAHSHLNGSAEPSKTDDRSTAKIHMLCSAHNATLIEHIVIAGNNSYSYAREGRLQHVKETCKIENMEF